MKKIKMVIFCINAKYWLNFFLRKENSSSKETDYLLAGRNGKILLQSIEELETKKGVKNCVIDF